MRFSMMCTWTVLVALPVAVLSEKKSIAVIGGGVAGSTATLELLRRAEENDYDLTIYEQADMLGHHKSASGIIAALIGFNAIDVYWRGGFDYLDFDKYFNKWFSRDRMDCPAYLRGMKFAELVVSNKAKDMRAQKSYQSFFFHTGKIVLEQLLDWKPELCTAIIGRFCCREGTPSHRWMLNEGKQLGLSCSKKMGITHVVSTEDEFRRYVNTDQPGQRGLQYGWDVENASSKWIQHLSMDYLKNTTHKLQGGAYNDADEGFVRVEEFFPLLTKIFERSKVTVATNCMVEKFTKRSELGLGVQARTTNNSLAQCVNDGIRYYDHVIVSGGANTPTIMKEVDAQVHDQMWPFKGFAVASWTSLVAPEDLQFGVEYESFGHYIRSMKNGGVFYGYGREVGDFDKELLDPICTGWINGTGPENTGIGQGILRASDHVTWCGFRPFNYLGNFPLLKNYKNTDYDGLLLNSGFGFYGYSMAWNSARLIADSVEGHLPVEWRAAVEDVQDTCGPEDMRFKCWNIVPQIVIGSIVLVVLLGLLCCCCVLPLCRDIRKMNLCFPEFLFKNTTNWLGFKNEDKHSQARSFTEPLIEDDARQVKLSRSLSSQLNPIEFEMKDQWKLVGDTRCLRTFINNAQMLAVFNFVFVPFVFFFAMMPNLSVLMILGGAGAMKMGIKGLVQSFQFQTLRDWASIAPPIGSKERYELVLDRAGCFLFYAIVTCFEVLNPELQAANAASAYSEMLATSTKERNDPLHDWSDSDPAKKFANFVFRLMGIRQALTILLIVSKGSQLGFSWWFFKKARQHLDGLDKTIRTQTWIKNGIGEFELKGEQENNSQAKENLKDRLDEKGPNEISVIKIMKENQTIAKDVCDFESSSIKDRIFNHSSIIKEVTTVKSVEFESQWRELMDVWRDVGHGAGLSNQMAVEKLMIWILQVDATHFNTLHGIGRRVGGKAVQPPQEAAELKFKEDYDWFDRGVLKCFFVKEARSEPVYGNITTFVLKVCADNSIGLFIQAYLIHLVLLHAPLSKIVLSLLTFASSLLTVSYQLAWHSTHLDRVAHIKLPRSGSPNDSPKARHWGMFKLFGHMLIMWFVFGLLAGALQIYPGWPRFNVSWHYRVPLPVGFHLKVGPWPKWCDIMWWSICVFLSGATLWELYKVRKAVGVLKASGHQVMEKFWKLSQRVAMVVGFIVIAVFLVSMIDKLLKLHAERWAIKEGEYLEESTPDTCQVENLLVAHLLDNLRWWK